MNLEPRYDFRNEEPRRTPPWLLTFTDVTALMLTFFVMILAMSTIPSEKWDAIVSVLSTRTGDHATGEPVARAARNIGTVSEKPALPLAYVSGLLNQHLSTLPELRRIRIATLDGAVALSFPAGMRFAPGRAQLPVGLADALGQIAGILDRFGNGIDVVGHAAPKDGEASGPGLDAGAGSWRLSLARAQSVAAALAQAGYAGSLRLVAEGASEFTLLPADQSLARRHAAARRVDIVIHATAGRT